MITVQRKGVYKLIETRGHVKILALDTDVFAWIVAKNIGEILVASHKPHIADHVLAAGVYRLYGVTDEPLFSDQTHLELNVGERLWQGYLLPTGLPENIKTRARIIPTKEVITSCKAREDVGRGEEE